MKRLAAVFGTALLGLIMIASSPAAACGGFFCSNVPVNQIGERIVFTINDNDTITTLVQIQYFGEADDFSWILPVPEAIEPENLKVPENGDDVFTALHDETDVRIIAPPIPRCATNILASMFGRDTDMIATSAPAAEVQVFSSGEVGPFGYDVIGSEDPDALVNWLRDNNYRVEPEMEPLIDIYVEMDMAFVAMRLLDGETADSISPIELTYGGTRPMIPLQLTAVAATPNMPIWVWIFADDQAVPTNFERMEIMTEELTFTPFGGNDYANLVGLRADALGGQAFITEYANPVDAQTFAGNQYLSEKADGRHYLTRLSTVVSPEEMTVDPMFTVEPGLPHVSNIRDASGMSGLYDCERDGGGILPTVGESAAVNPLGSDGAITPTPSQVPAVNVVRNRVIVSLWTLALGAVILGGSVRASRRRFG